MKAWHPINMLELARWSYVSLWAMIFAIGLISGRFAAIAQVFGSLGIVLLVTRQAFHSPEPWSRHLSSAIIAVIAGIGSLLALMTIVEAFRVRDALVMDRLPQLGLTAFLLASGVSKGLSATNKYWPKNQNVKDLAFGSVAVTANLCVVLVCLAFAPCRGIATGAFWTHLAMLWGCLSVFWFLGAWLLELKSIESSRPPALPPMRTVGALRK
jgi:hypothetical protein